MYKIIAIVLYFFYDFPASVLFHFYFGPYGYKIIDGRMACASPHAGLSAHIVFIQNLLVLLL